MINSQERINTASRCKVFHPFYALMNNIRVLTAKTSHSVEAMKIAHSPHAYNYLKHGGSGQTSTDDGFRRGSAEPCSLVMLLHVIYN